MRRPAFLAAVVWLYAACAAAHARSAWRPPVAAARPSTTPPVAVVVPARDEADGLPAALASLRALDWPALTVVVVDDESSDGTGAIIAAAAAADPRVRAVAGTSPPPGWIGKQWALAQGVAVTDATPGSWLLFADADVRHRPESLAVALAHAKRHDAAAVSLAPTILAGSRAERIVTAAALGAIAAFVAPAFLVASRRAPVALAAGGHLLVRRDAYERAGGHAAIRDRMIDDVALAEALKRAGTPVRLAAAAGLVDVPMYPSLGAAVRGWRKSAAHGMRGGPAAAASGATAALALGLVPPAAVAAGLRRRDPALLIAGTAGMAGAAAARLALRSLAPGPPVEALAAPAGMAALGVIGLASVRDRLRGGAVWRGRRYAFAR